jgi:hypothetical protein
LQPSSGAMRLSERGAMRRDRLAAHIALLFQHPIYDYASYFPAVGLELRDEKRFRPYKIGPGGFAALAAIRPAA